MNGACLRTLRKCYGLSRGDVAEHLGVSPRIITDYETGAKQPSLDKAIKLASFFGIKLDDLASDENCSASFSTALKKNRSSRLLKLDEVSRYKFIRRISRDFGKNVHDLRESLGVSIEYLSESTSISLSQLALYETVYREIEEPIIPTRKHVETLASFLGKSVDDLFGVNEYSAEHDLDEWIAFLNHGLETKKLTDMEFANLLEVTFEDIGNRIKTGKAISDSTLIFKIALILEQSLEDIFSAAGYTFFDFDQFNPFGERIELNIDKSNEIVDLINNDPRALKLFEEYVKADEKLKSLLLDIWDKIHYKWWF